MLLQLPIVVTYIFVLFSSNNTIKNVVSRYLPTQCPLEFKKGSLNSTYEEGTWNGFVRDKCCKEPFNVYLDALALHANQTGNIYLSLDEQTSCLKKIKDNVTNVFTCGIEKLTNGEKGYSGLSVQDVLEELKDDMESFNSGCRLLGNSGGYWNQTCRNCVKSWKEIKGIEDGDGDADLCRFAVLTSWTSSRMDEHFWINNIRKCLGEQVFYEDVNTDIGGKKKKNSGKDNEYLDQSNYIGEGTSGKNGVLSWTQRLEIAVDCARGLWFLHTYSEGCIVHHDIKPTNILLGPNCEAKLSDFGLSKVIDIGETYASSEARGTFGYIDPEYQGDCQVNAAGDIYSFGIVLLQILSGRRVINMNASKPMNEMLLQTVDASAIAYCCYVHFSVVFV